MGVGLVEAVDDMRLDQPAEQREAARRGGEVPGREQVRPQGADAGDPPKSRRTSVQPARCPTTRRPPVYSRYYPRRLMAEVMLDAITQVTGAPTQFYRESGDRRNRNIGGLGDPYPTRCGR